MAKIVCLALGSLAGGFARYYLAGAVHKGVGYNLPYGTLAVNLLGCFVIGALSAVADEKFFLGPNGRILLMTGFCGAFTTFSTWMLETDQLVKGGDYHRAFLYVALSVLLGFFLFRLGAAIGGKI